MAWSDEIVAIVRQFINDADETTQAYTDDRLEGAIVAAARLVAMELTFPQTYLADAVNVDIKPDPTITPRDENFINLVSVKTACIIDRGSAIKAAGQAILVQDGTSKVDLREQYKAWVALLAKGWCAVYDQLREDYVTSQNSVGVGAAIVGQLRVCAGYPVRGMVFETNEGNYDWWSR